MSTQQQHSRNKGSLFENNEKKKPSHPDLRGECAIDGAAYDMQAWRRDERLSLTLAPTRQGNSYPPDAFRGSLDPAPRAKGRGSDRGEAAPTYTGDVVGDEQSYRVNAFELQGKSGPYLKLFFELAEPAPS